MSNKRASIGPSRLRSSRQRRLLLESLETRQLLAGDITASVVDGRLTLTGDAAANEVFVGDLGGGRFVVRGMPDLSGTATTINGQAEVIVENVTDITANLGGGDDRFLFSAESDWNGGNPFSQGWEGDGFKPLLYGHGFASLAGKLVVNLGDGNDTAVITGSASAGMEIEGGSDAGDDGVFIRTNVAQSTHYVAVNLGGGNDYVALSLESIPDAVDVTTGDGNDTVMLSYLTDANLNVDTGAGNDRVVVEGGWTSPGVGGPPPANGTDNTLKILTGTGDDNIELTQLFASKLIVDSGLGRDDIDVKGININGDVDLRGGNLIYSDISLTDYNRLSMGRIDSNGVWNAETYIDTRIGGNVTISSNVDEQNNVSGPSYVTLGQEKVNGVATGVIIGGKIQFYGTISDDELNINPLTAGSLVVDMGYGRDTVRARGITINGDVDIQLNDGNDRALMIEDAVYEYVGNPDSFALISASGLYTATHIGGNLRLDFGAGEESFNYPSEPGEEIRYLFSVGARHSGLTSNFVVAGDLLVNAGEGTTRFNVVAGTFRNIDIKLGDGYSTLDMQVFFVEQSLSITSGSLYRDRWNIDAFGIGGSVTLRSGSGDADIKIGTVRPLISNIEGDLWVTTSSGNDQVTLGMAPINGQAPPAALSVKGVLQVDTLGGNDAVKLFQLRDIDVLLARLGDGSDVLDVFGVEADYGLLDGGAGDPDLLNMNGDSYQPRNFEQHGGIVFPDWVYDFHNL